MSLILKWFTTILRLCRDDWRGKMFVNQSQYCNVKEIYCVTKASANLCHGVQVLSIVEQSRTLAMRWNHLNLQMSLNFEEPVQQSCLEITFFVFFLNSAWCGTMQEVNRMWLIGQSVMNPPLTQSDAVCFPSCCCGKCCCVHSRTLQHLRIMLDLPTQIVASATVSQVNSTTAATESCRLLAGSLQINLPWVPNCVKALGVINCRH